MTIILKKIYKYFIVPPSKACSGTERKLILCSLKTLALLPIISFKFHAFRLQTFNFSSNHFLKSVHNTHICHKLFLCSFESFCSSHTPGKNLLQVQIQHTLLFIIWDVWLNFFLQSFCPKLFTYFIYSPNIGNYTFFSVVLISTSLHWEFITKLDL